MSRTRLLLAGIEGTYATDPTLAPGTHAILTTGLEITPLEVEEIDRNLDIVGVGNTEVALTAKRARVRFGVEVAGGGAAATEPAWGVLARACGFAETADVDHIDYDLIDDPSTCESAYLYVYWRGKLHKLSGARGAMSLSMPSRDLARWQFDFQGLFVAVSEATPTAPDFSAFQTPLEVGNTHTTFTYDSYSAVLESLELDLGQQIAYVHRVGREAIEFEDAAPSGSMTIETPALATKNFFTLAGGAPKAMSLVHGTTAGNIVEIAIDQMQTMPPTYVDLDDDGDGLQIPLRPIGSGIHITTR
jgi:hypothetical protein